MFSLKRMLALSGLTGVCGALAFAIPAGASLKAQCVVNGDAKATTTKNAKAGGPPVKYVQAFGGKGTFEFRSVAVQCVNVPELGKGPTTASGTVEATGTFRNSNLVPPPPAPGGVWVNTPCGQGKVMGTISDDSVFTDPKYDQLKGKKFAVEFGPPSNGAFYWHHASPKPMTKPATPIKLQPDTGDPRYPGKANPTGSTKPYRYSGQIQLGPSTDPMKDPVSEAMKVANSNQTDPVVVEPQAPERGLAGGKCTKGFSVNGTVTVHEI